MRILALDHGAARTGVAVSDPTGTIARPLEPIARVEGPDGQRALRAIIDEHEPETIVVGEPLLMSGERGEQARVAAAFARRVARESGRPVHLLDERLTSAEADRRRREAGSRSDLDSLSACVLLEAFLAGAR
jgi:putative Holliday junction resolvase